MDNDIDYNRYYVTWHVKGWFDCCWITPNMKLPKHIAKDYLNGIIDADEIKIMIKECNWSKYSSVNLSDIEIINVHKTK